VVAEILGDGLLVFWNTPGDVYQHAARACEAALAQQEALVLLNAELRALGMPQLAIRIGLHTGPVLSGNIGSHKKMKFGCMGDAVNIASRLEGLCKFYGISVICSAATHAGLPPDSGIICRRLDLVQLKGKREPTSIYEVMSRERKSSQDAEASVNLLPSSDDELAEEDEDLEMDHSASLACNGSRSAKSKVKWLGSSPCSRESMSPRSFRCIFEAAEQSVPAVTPVEHSLAAEAPAEEQLACARLYEGALDAYQAADFARACSLARQLLEVHPTDGPAANLLKRASQHTAADGRVTGLSEDELSQWTGVVVMTEK